MRLLPDEYRRLGGAVGPRGDRGGRPVGSGGRETGVPECPDGCSCRGTRRGDGGVAGASERVAVRGERLDDTRALSFRFVGGD